MTANRQPTRVRWTDDERRVTSSFWFAWSHETIKRALYAPIMCRLLPAAKAAFGRNQVAGRGPTSWPELDQPLQRNPRNLIRTGNGEHIATPEFLLGAAAVLRLNVLDFFPEDTAEWVAWAAYYLATVTRLSELEAQGETPFAAFEKVRDETTGPTLKAARVYARLLLQSDQRATTTDSHRWWEEQAGADWPTVQRVFCLLATPLRVVHQELESRRNAAEERAKKKRASETRNTDATD